MFKIILRMRCVCVVVCAFVCVFVARALCASKGKVSLSVLDRLQSQQNGGYVVVTALLQPLLEKVHTV